MRKILIQGAYIIALFFSAILILNQVDWITLLGIEKASVTTEEKLGDLLWEFLDKTEKEVNNTKITIAIDSILLKICQSNGIDNKLVKLHIVKKDEINAFALPGNHLVIYSGLILNTENEAELSGIICHELAHMQMNHVMKKLVKEVGLSVLISMTTRNSGSEILVEAAKLLSSTAYDRTLEEEADIRAVDYLIKSQINPEGLAIFLYRLANEESDIEKQLSWISTHPATKERAENIIEYSKNKAQDFQPILTQETWENIKASLQEY